VCRIGYVVRGGEGERGVPLLGGVWISPCDYGNGNLIEADDEEE